MGITAEDIYKFEHDLIRKAFEFEDDSSLHTVKTLETIRGAHVMASGLIAKLEKEEADN